MVGHNRPVKPLVFARIAIQAAIGFYLSRIVWDLFTPTGEQPSWVVFLFLIPAAAWVFDTGLHLREWQQAHRARASVD
jgi:hypothetical protein